MSFIDDISSFHSKYGFYDQQLDKRLLEFRLALLKEEMDELEKAIIDNSPEDTVDALIDLLYVALGTLDLARVDTQKAWDAVHQANMAKLRGTKPGREASGGFDVYKPNGWVAPSHEGNHGALTDLYNYTTAKEFA